MKEKWRLIKSIISLSTVASLLVLSIFAYSGSFAWMAKSTDVNASGISITAKNETIIKSVKYYRVTDTVIESTSAGKQNVYKFGYNEAVLNTQYVYGQESAKVKERDSFETPIGMRPYSELSGDCQVLVEITLLKATASVSLGLSAPADSEFLGTTVKNIIENNTYNFNPTNLPLSSVIHFGVILSLGNDTATQEFIVRESNITQEVCFIKGNATDGYEFNHALSGSGKITGTIEKFYIFFDYKSSLVEYINDKVIEYVDKAMVNDVDLTYPITLGETNLNFNPDFELFVQAGGN